MNKIKLLVISAVLILTGCQTTKELYEWSNYESTLYEYRKEPNDLNLQKHRSQLEFIIATATNKNTRVPPGIYFELGMIEAKLGDTGRSIEFLMKEKAAFPEARVYVDNAINTLKGNS